MELRPPTARERQKIIDECEWLERMIADYNDIIAAPADRQRRTLSDDLAETVRLHGDESRSRFVPADGFAQWSESSS